MTRSRSAVVATTVLATALVTAIVTAFIMGGAIPATTAAVNPVQAFAARRAIRNEVVEAYDLTKLDVPSNLMALYAPSGPIRSASGGRVTTSRDSIRAGIEAFWTNVGRNMRDPRVEWTRMDIDVLAPGVAVMTATYRIPHRQPNGLPHVIGGAWTAVFLQRGGHWYITQEHLSDDPFAS